MTDGIATKTPTWLKTAEAAPHLRTTPETLINWATSGRIPEYAWRGLPKGYLFLADWIADPVFTTARARQEPAGRARQEPADAAPEMVGNAD